MWGIVPISPTNIFQIPLREVERLPYDHLLYGMATCHSITIMNGELKGDPLDLKMFESTNWILEEANISDDTKYDLLFPTIVRPPKRAQLGKYTFSFFNKYLKIILNEYSEQLNILLNSRFSYTYIKHMASFVVIVVCVINFIYSFIYCYLILNQQ